jgi:restriction endonuclease S subunit
MIKTQQQLVAQLLAEKQERLKELASWSFKELNEMKNRYYESFKETNSEVVWEKLQIVSEAIDIKTGNKEQAWDYLS